MATKKDTTRKDAQPATRPAKAAPAPKAAPKHAAASTAGQPAQAARIAAADADGATAAEVADEARAPSDVSDEQIARRAYELYVERGGEHGRAHEDWARAERELRGHREAGPGRH